MHKKVLVSCPFQREAVLEYSRDAHRRKCWSIIEMHAEKCLSIIEMHASSAGIQ